MFHLRVRPKGLQFNRQLIHLIHRAGTVRGSVLVLSITGVDLEAGRVRQEIDSELDRIESYLTSLRGSADRLNGALDSIARQCVEQRREKLLADQSLVASLGFKLKQRSDSSKTYVAPEVRRKITPKLPPASLLPYKPENQPWMKRIMNTYLK